MRTVTEIDAQGWPVERERDQREGTTAASAVLVCALLWMAFGAWLILRR